MPIKRIVLKGKHLLFSLIFLFTSGLHSQIIELDSQKYEKWKIEFGFKVNTINPLDFCASCKFGNSQRSEILQFANHYVASTSKKLAIEMSSENFTYLPLTKSQEKLLRELSFIIDAGNLCYLDSHSRCLIIKKFDKNSLELELRKFNILEIKTAKKLNFPSSGFLSFQNLFESKYRIITNGGSEFIIDSILSQIQVADTALYLFLFNNIHSKEGYNFPLYKFKERIFYLAAGISNEVYWRLVEILFSNKINGVQKIERTTFIVFNKNNSVTCKELNRFSDGYVSNPSDYFRILSDSTFETMNLLLSDSMENIALIAQYNLLTGNFRNTCFIDSLSYYKIRKDMVSDSRIIYFDSNYIVFVNSPYVYNRQTKELKMLGFVGNIHKNMKKFNTPKFREFSKNATGYEGFFTIGQSFYKLEYDLKMNLVNVSVSSAKPFYQLSFPNQYDFLFGYKPEEDDYYFVPINR